MLTSLFTSRSTQILFLFTLLAVMLGTVVFFPLSVLKIQQYTFDNYNRLMPRPNGKDVTIVGIDQESTKYVNAWPMGRDTMGDLVAGLKELGAKSITFDVTYTYSDVTGARTVEAGSEDSRTVRSIATPKDIYFAKHIREAGNVILGFSLVQQDRGTPPSFPPKIAYDGGTAEQMNQLFHGHPYFMDSFGILSEAAAGSGHVIFITSDDGVMRFFPMMMSRTDPKTGQALGLYPAISLEALRVALGPDTAYKVSGTPRGLRGLSVGHYPIPTDENGVARIYYAGREGRNYVPMWEVLAKKADPALVKDKIVLIGAMSENMGDIRLSPLDIRIFGVESHAEVIEQVLYNQFLTRNDLMSAAEILLAFLISAAVIFVAQEMNALLLAFLLAAGLSLCGLGGMAAFKHLGWLLDPLVPAGVSGIIFILAAILAALRTQIVSHEKSKFLALMSHEIRTPMTGILGMIEFMKDDSLTKEEQEEYVNTISDCSKTLLNTLNDILDVSKLEEGKLEISNINLDLHEVLNNSAELLQRMARDKGLYLKVEIEDGVPRHMHGDPHRIRQCVMNFMNNAIKFTSKGGVTVHCARKEGEPPVIRIEVRDTGIGISEKNMNKLFKGFSQVDSSVARKYGGTGLGLSIAKDLVILMGGQVGVNSELGKGSTFWLELPWHPPTEAQEEEDENIDVPPLRVLLAEDNKVNQQVAMRLLTNKGHTVAIADDGVSVVAMAQERDFDMILMDMNMPVKSGIDATRDLRAMGGKFADIPIIALTANVVDEYVQKCYKAGMNAHVAKPFSPKELYKTMARFAPARATGAEKTAAAEPPLQLEGLNDNLKEIGKQLGAAYLNEYINNSLKESDRLLREARRAHESGEVDALQSAVHDLKNASGMIGLAETNHLAMIVETLCRNSELTALPEIMKALGRDGTREIRRMERQRGLA